MGFSRTTASFFSILGGPTKVEKLDVDVMDTIDAMERGFVGALALDKVKPEAKGRKRKMIVERSEDRLCYVLYEDLERILEARVTDDGVHVYAAGSGSKTSNDVPAFTLTHDADKKNWTIASNHCAKCAYRNPFNSCQKTKGGQRIGFIRHGIEDIGEGRAMCMDVDIPQIGNNGEGEIWCALCDGPDDARIELSSLRPKWNEKLGSLCMDFKGRVEAASAKNFQLCLDEQSVLMYGKKNNGTFALEFEHPLSTAQAFTIALSTMYWT